MVTGQKGNGRHAWVWELGCSSIAVVSITGSAHCAVFRLGILLTTVISPTGTSQSDSYRSIGTGQLKSLHEGGGWESSRGLSSDSVITSWT